VFFSHVFSRKGSDGGPNGLSRRKGLEWLVVPDVLACRHPINFKIRRQEIILTLYIQYIYIYVPHVCVCVCVCVCVHVYAHIIDSKTQVYNTWLSLLVVYRGWCTGVVYVMPKVSRISARGVTAPRV